MSPWSAIFLFGPGLLSYEKPEAQLELAAQVSPRPQSCREAGSFWPDRARLNAAWCSLLARGYSALSRQPKQALEIARQLSSHPTSSQHELQAEPALLAARANVLLRDFAEARVAFEQAKINSPEQLSDPATLHDYALTQVATGQLKAGNEAYRLLLFQINLLPANHNRHLRAVVESALALMRSSPDGAAAAIAFLRPHVARREYRGADHYVLAALNLALDRTNVPLLEQDWRQDAAQHVRDRNQQDTKLPWLLPHEWLALEAVHYGPARRAEALDAWTRYLAAAPADDPWRSHAERRLRGGSSGSTP